MQLKIHESYRRVIALADSDLVGKKFEEGKMQLEVRENFYKDEEVSYEEVIEVLQREADNYAMFNIVGKESVKSAMDAGIITEDNIGKVNGIPFALVLL